MRQGEGHAAERELSAPVFGAVYFRGGENPPREDWERDYRTAEEDGQSLMRHWVCWNNVETAPGVYRWEDYDRQMELAEQHGMSVVLAEMLIDFPEWLIHQLPEARVVGADGIARSSEMHVSCATGGHFALCLDHPVVREAACGFLVALASRYRGHPALLGYDLWNECTLYWHDRYCHCSATQRQFRAWLRARYGTVEALGERWGRRSLSDFGQAVLPRSYQLYREALDALEFHADMCQEHLRWRAAVIRGVDPDAMLIAHGNARNEVEMAVGGADDWRSASAVSVFGYTYYYAHGVSPWYAADATRSASGGKPFIRAEAIGDTDFLRRTQRTPAPPPRYDRDAVGEPENIRLDALVSLAAGARGFQNPRWRPLLEGPLFGAFGWYGMDGSRSARSRVVAELAAWVRDATPTGLWKARPVRGDAGVLILPDAARHGLCFHGSPDPYGESIKGTYEALQAANISCDPICLGQLHEYRVVFLPHALTLSDEVSAALLGWVREGGTLVLEGATGYFRGARAFARALDRGWAEALGCVQADVHFGADRWNEQVIRTREGGLPASLIRQTFIPGGGCIEGTYADGSAAVVSHGYGAGRTRVVGAMPGYAYRIRPSAAAVAWYRSALDLAGVRQQVEVRGAGEVVVRHWRGDAGTRYLWAVNMDREDAVVEVSVGQERTGSQLRFAGTGLLRGGSAAVVGPGTLRIGIRGRDATVLELVRDRN